MQIRFGPAREEQAMLHTTIEGHHSGKRTHPLPETQKESSLDWARWGGFGAPSLFGGVSYPYPGRGLKGNCGKERFLFDELGKEATSFH